MKNKRMDQLEQTCRRQESRVPDGIKTGGDIKALCWTRRGLRNGTRPPRSRSAAAL